MSSYLNKLQAARKIAVEKYLADNGIKHTVVKHRSVDHYLIPDDKYLCDREWSAYELVNWIGLEVEIEE